MPRTDDPQGDCIDFRTLLSADELVAFADAFAGRRIYVPARMKSNHAIARAVGLEAAERLAQRLGHGLVRVPLMRAERARHYRKQGLSNGAIASKLGMTESGVEKLFERLRETSSSGRAPTLKRTDSS